jgi:NAD(P)-dependent dehydrogenase (short-subunit alcohol dehydrogenase family)
LARYLQTPQHAFEGARPHHLIFTALILIPSFNYPIGPVATISPEHISDLLNTRLLHPILVTQSFLPLLSSLPYPHAHHHFSPHPPPPRPKVILLTPTIISSLSPPFHAPESLIISGLTAFTESLSGELAPLGIPVAHLKLGAFDFSTVHPRNQLRAQTLQAQRAEMLCWPEGTRQIYGRNFLSVAERGPIIGGPKGSSLRELHNAVFDAMTKRKSGTIRVGMGSSTYEFVGAWVPKGLVGWMMGMRRIRRTGTVTSGSESGSDAGKEEVGMSGESEYVTLDR